jgi:hypothetical protein
MSSTHPEGPATGHLDTGDLSSLYHYEIILSWLPFPKLPLAASHSALSLLNSLNVSSRYPKIMEVSVKLGGGGQNLATQLYNCS